MIKRVELRFHMFRSKRDHLGEGGGKTRRGAEVIEFKVLSRNGAVA